ncbi:MAG: hypothetical protein H0T08_08080 [Acidobacteria bacterium]|nr:hypothetical protein [Acidobacteriota bacterium]
MRSNFTQKMLFILIFAASVFAQNSSEIVAANGEKYPVAGRDRTRNDNEIVVFTTDFYKKKPTFKNGVDVYVVDGKVSVIQDRAGAIYLFNKPDPGVIAVGKDGFVFSAQGDARKWVVANIKVGDAVAVSEIKINKNSSGEIVPSASLPCFAGAYYRKAVTSFDVWTGIGGLVKLGTPKVDENRLDEKDKQPLDNFSVYMGGNAGGKSEVDAGLSWEFTLDETGKRSSRRNAFRPFWRTKTWNSAPDEKKFYFYPGETVQMAVLVAGPNKLRLIISDGKTKTFQTDFDAEGFTANIPRQFKRVNAIDQRHNEGKPVQPTRAEITGAEWMNTILLRGAGADAKQIPMDKTRFTDMRCAGESNISVTTTGAAKGAEKIDIYGTPKK